MLKIKTSTLKTKLSFRLSQQTRRASRFHQVSSSLLEQAFPRHCLLCLSAQTLASTALCNNCHQDLPWTPPSCGRCGLPIEPLAASTNQQEQVRYLQLATQGALLCGQCIAQLPTFDHCHSACLYQAPLVQLISDFKYRANFASGQLLAELLIHSLRSRLLNNSSLNNHRLPQAVVAVPLHWRKLSQRGFNQSQQLCNALAQAFGLVQNNLVQRVRMTESQQGLTLKQRQKNIRGAFAIKVSKRIPKHVALVDDVVTTGATVEEITKRLKQAGVQRVDVWCIARTLERS